MHYPNSGLRESPFNKPGRPAAFVPYRSQQEAFRFLGNILTDERGVGLLHGPAMSGKSTLVEQYIRELRTDVAVAVVDGGRLKTPQLLSKILTQFGYDVQLSSADELLQMLTVFAVQQTRARQAPLIVLENINNMYPSALCALCKLASITARDKFALRFVLVSNRDFRHVIGSPSMNTVAMRMVGDFEIQPLTAKETAAYLYTKLRTCGVLRPDDIFSVDVCDKLHSASGGWPGRLEKIAASVLDLATDFPIRAQDVEHPDAHKSETAPRLIVTLNGETTQDFKLGVSRALIGRADMNDIVLEDQFVSKQHALLVREQDAVILMDLKSANGTYVNSRRVQSAVLHDNDIISLGDHRIKMIYANSPALSGIEDPDLADTATMKNIADARRAKSRWDKAVTGIGKKKA